MDKALVKVLHYSSHAENCGVGKYQEMFLAAMPTSANIENKFFEVSPHKIKLMPKTERAAVFARLADEVRNYDILHIQHEFGFYWHDELKHAVEAAKKNHKKVVVTVHASPNLAHQKPRLGGFGPRSILGYARQIVRQKRFYSNFLSPLKQADVVLVHNEVTKTALVQRGVEEAKISKINIPVPLVQMSVASDRLKKELQVSKGDVVLCTVGFMHRYKGIKQAVKALRYLPANYKLAIIGGIHNDSTDLKLYDEVADLIRDLNLQDRVSITGYIADDEQLNALIRECDITLYPYDKNYYANVSSASLNNAFANHKPVVAYPTASFEELNAQLPAISLTDAFSYYELARLVRKLDIRQAAADSTRFAEEMSYVKLAPALANLYRSLA